MAKENKASKLGVMSKIDSNYLREIWPDEAGRISRSSH